MIQAQLDPNDFDVYPHVAVLDEFRMTNDDGSFAAEINAQFIARLVAHMREREAATGDLAPYVIGHTKPGENETNSPPLVGYARNWVQDAFFETGRTAAFADLWVRKVNRVVVDGVEMTLTSREVVERWPRRSSEVWPERFEIDPISALGATTPARDLGTIRLNRGGSFTYTAPGDTTVPNPLPTDQSGATAAADAAGGVANSPIMQEILAALKALPQTIVAALAGQSGPTAGPGDAGAGAASAGAGSDGGGDISDEELEALLNDGGEMDPGPAGGAEPPEDASRKGDKPVQNMGYAGGANTHVANPVKLARVASLEQEVANLKNENAKFQLSRELSKLRDKGIDVDPDDQELLADLASQPADMRSRSVARIVKLARRAPVTNHYGLETALAHSTDGTAGRRVQTKEDQAKVIQLARQKGVAYEAAAAELGFTV